jgi:hypothetical protein
MERHVIPVHRIVAYALSNSAWAEVVALLWARIVEHVPGIAANVSRRAGMACAIQRRTVRRAVGIVGRVWKSRAFPRLPLSRRSLPSLYLHLSFPRNQRRVLRSGEKFWKHSLPFSRLCGIVSSGFASHSRKQSGPWSSRFSNECRIGDGSSLG